MPRPFRPNPRRPTGLTLPFPNRATVTQAQPRPGPQQGQCADFLVPPCLPLQIELPALGSDRPPILGLRDPLKAVGVGTRITPQKVDDRKVGRPGKIVTHVVRPPWARLVLRLQEGLDPPPKDHCHHFGGGGEVVQQDVDPWPHDRDRPPFSPLPGPLNRRLDSSGHLLPCLRPAVPEYGLQVDLHGAVLLAGGRCRSRGLHAPSLTGKRWGLGDVQQRR